MERDSPIVSGVIKYTEHENRTFADMFQLTNIDIADSLYLHLSCDLAYRSLFFEEHFKGLSVQLCWELIKEKRRFANRELSKFNFEEKREELFSYIDSLEQTDQNIVCCSYMIPLLFPDPESSALAC